MEANSKPMYQPWNEEEFQADVFVRGMTWLQRHLYRSLLQAMFFHTTRPYLPNDDEVLWVLAGAESPEMWEQNKTKILKRFTACAERPNLLENKRVTADWERLSDARNRMAELGKRSAAARATFNGGSTVVERTSNVPLLVVNGEATREVEVECSEEKVSSETPAATEVSSSAKQPMADWKNIALRHRSVFGRKAGVSFKDKYFEACKTYGEDVVLQCFDDWAAGAKDWVEANNVREPLFSFFKKLPDEAADAVELNVAEKEQHEAEQLLKEKKESDFQKSLALQIKENQEQWTPKPQTNVETLEDFLKEE